MFPSLALHPDSQQLTFVCLPSDPTSLPVTNLHPHSHYRTDNSSQMGSFNLGIVLCQSPTARTAGGNMWLELRKGVPLYSSEGPLLFPGDTLPVHPKWPLYCLVTYR